MVCLSFAVILIHVCLSSHVYMLHIKDARRNVPRKNSRRGLVLAGCSDELRRIYIHLGALIGRVESTKQPKYARVLMVLPI